MSQVGQVSRALVEPVEPAEPAEVASPRFLGRHRHPAAWRSLHPGAWWLWAGGLALAAMRTTNVVVLGLIIAVVAVVVSARRSDAPWARSFRFFVWMAVAVVVFRLLQQILIGDRLPGTVVFTLPSVGLPSWAAGVSVGGQVTVEALVDAFQRGLQLAVVLICFGAVNSLCSPYRMLQALPAALYEAGVAVTVALTFAPEAVIELGRLRASRRLRGRPVRGVAALRGLALPVLEGGLERAVALAASMDSRGYGRRDQASGRARRLGTAATVVGLLVVALGLYGLADAGAPGALGLPLVGLGAGALAVGLFAAGRRSVRTRYRPDPWRLPEWIVSASGVVAAGATVVAARLPGGAAALNPATSPLVWPAVPVLAVAGILVALVPAVAAPRPAGSGPTP
jgi:energy-coupling factor transport system permease protein